MGDYKVKKYFFLVGKFREEDGAWPRSTLGVSELTRFHAASLCGFLLATGLTFAFSFLYGVNPLYVVLYFVLTYELSRSIEITNIWADFVPTTKKLDPEAQ